MNFYRGMRRVAVVIWILGSVMTFIANSQGTAATIGYAAAMVAAWSAGFWIFVWVVRFVWLGFAKDEKK